MAPTTDQFYETNGRWNKQGQADTDTGGSLILTEDVHVNYSQVLTSAIIFSSLGTSQQFKETHRILYFHLKTTVCLSTF